MTTRTADGRRARHRLVYALVALTITLLLAAAVTANAYTSGEDDVTAEGDNGYIEIECGGYDHTGTLVQPEATEIDRAPLDADGVPEIPEICGGYTQDGTFIGDE